MRLKALLAEDDNAVSPVIGVILMVAITVILAAVIASFVLGLGPSSAAPTINFDSEYDGSGTLTVEVTGGDTVPANQISINAGNGTTAEWHEYTGTSLGPNSEITSGESVEVGASSLSDDYEVTVTWQSEDGGTTQTLTTFEG